MNGSKGSTPHIKGLKPECVCADRDVWPLKLRDAVCEIVTEASITKLSVKSQTSLNKPSNSVPVLQLAGCLIILHTKHENVLLLPQMVLQPARNQLSLY